MAKLSDAQRKLILDLVLSGATPTVSQCGLPAKPRSQLQKAGLIHLFKVDGERAQHVELTDKAWAWVAEHLADPFTTTVQLRPVFNALVARLSRYLARADHSLLEFIQMSDESGHDDIPPSGADGESLGARIRSAYLQITGQWEERARLSELRAKLTDVQTADLDEALRRMLDNRELILMPMDDPREKTSDDERAALTIQGERKHVVYMKG